MAHEYTKKQRQQILKRIIGEQLIGDQTRLMDELRAFGIDATQATISRDFQDMGVVKVRVRPGIFKYQIIERIPTEVVQKKLKVLFDNFLVDIKSTGNQLLLKTTPGNANGVASFVDRLNKPEILGTVAGDDTILVVVDTEKNREKVEEEFQLLFESPPSEAETEEQEKR